MGAFAAGFGLGQRAWEGAADEKRQKVLDDRAAEEYAFKKDERARGLQMRQKEDDAYGSLESLNKGIVEGGNWSAPAGYEADGPVPREAQFNPAAGLTPRKATDREYNQAYQGVAMAKRDMAGLATLRKEGRDIDFTDGYKRYVAEYKGDDSQIGATANFVNTTSKSLSMGDPDKNGFVRMSVVKPDGRAEFLKLGTAEQAKLYAGVKMMEQDPERALGLIGEVNKNLAASIAQENGLGAIVSKENNDTAGKRGDLGIKQQQVDQQGAYQRASIGLQRDRVSAAGGSGGKSARLTPMESLTREAERMVEAGHFKNVPKAIEALKRGAAKDQDNEQWMKIEAKMVEADAPQENILKQRQSFLMRRGHAPEEAVQIIQGGVNPQTRKPLTPDEVTDFNKRYPMSAVDMDDLPWAQAQTRRLGLINQIPR